MVNHRRDPTRATPQGQVAPAPNTSAPLPPERVARALARAGVASRRDAERMIEEGRIAINGVVLTSPAVNVKPGDVLTLDGAVVADREPARVWLHHKPVGLLNSHKDPKGRPTVFERLPTDMPRVISIGRLDLNSEGLLLLTNDGALARALELPSSGLVRRYRARAYGHASQEKLERLKAGITVEGVEYGPIDARLEKSSSGSNVWIMVSLSEGKNREVRRVLEHLGLKVNRLIRVEYGPFELGGLLPGAVLEVSSREVRQKLAGLVPAELLPMGDASGAARRAAPGVAKLSPKEAMHANLKAKPGKPGRPVRGRPGQDRAGPQPAGAPGRKGRIAEPSAADPATRPKRALRKPSPKDDVAKEPIAYKAGWARPKPKAKPRTTPKPKPRGR